MIASLEKDGTLFYPSQSGASGAPSPIYFTIYNSEGNNARAYLLYLFRCTKSALKQDNIDTLIQGENHGMDNDVEHVHVEGSNQDYFTGISSGFRYQCDPLARYLFDYRTYSGDQHPLANTIDLKGRKTINIVDDLYLSYFESVRIYDPSYNFRYEPMYTDYTLSTFTFAIKATSAYSHRIEVRFTSRRVHCFFDGTVQSDKTITFPYYIPLSERRVVGGRYEEVDVGESAEPNLERNWDLKKLREDCYYECLRLLPQIHQSARSKAFEEAFEGLTKLDTNNIANAKSLLDILKPLFKGDIKSALAIPKSAKDWWLWYRYVYCTSKSDAEVFKEYFSDFKANLNAQRFTVYSCLTDEREDIPVTWRCGVTLHTVLKDWVDSVDQLVYKLGLYPGLVNLWDMVPYSFVVDWFVPIGTICQQLETNLRANCDQYVFERINYSVSCATGSLAYNGIRYSYYKRWSESGPPPVRFWVGKPTYSPSKKVIFKRCIDGVCLFLLGG